MKTCTCFCASLGCNTQNICQNESCFQQTFYGGIKHIFYFQHFFSMNIAVFKIIEQMCYCMQNAVLARCWKSQWCLDCVYGKVQSHLFYFVVVHTSVKHLLNRLYRYLIFYSEYLILIVYSFTVIVLNFYHFE